MARVLLILPHLPQRMGAPYLGQQYVAASLLDRGHEVSCIDLAAVRWDASTESVIARVEAFAPDLIGYTLFTYNALAGYRLRDQLAHVNAVHVAGGSHTTVRPREALDHGFDAAVIGEGERAMPLIAEALDAGAWPRAVPGVQTGAGITPGGFLDDLDTLPWPLHSYDCYDPTWYLPPRPAADDPTATEPPPLVVPGGLMTSRGCPAKCTFCANHVTGRTFRWRHESDILAEMRTLRSRYDLRHFAFWDDAFTANRPRLRAFCAALQKDPALQGVTWSCITPANMARRETLELMASSGCVAINFGIESGDASTLRSIAKGQRPSHVFDAVAVARELGMSTVVNFMFGFPGETVEALSKTLGFMRELAPHTTWFNNRGVLVPFPGTPVYELHHVQYGFTDWWLDPRYLDDEPNLWALDPRDVQSWLSHDPTLDLDFYGYAPDVREMIARCVRFKAEHNAAQVKNLQETATAQARSAIAS